MADDDWSPYLVLAVFVLISYFIMKWLKRRSQYVHLPQLADGQWHPLVANYGWAQTAESENEKFRSDYEKLKSESSTTAAQLAQALMRRAMHDVKQISEMQQQKHTLTQLVRNGSINDDMLQQFNNLEQFLNQECEEVAGEAEQLKDGWSRQIFGQAAQLIEAELRRQQEVEKKRDLESQKSRDKSNAEEKLRLREEEARRVADELIVEEERLKKRDQAKNGKKKK